MLNELGSVSFLCIDKVDFSFQSLNFCSSHSVFHFDMKENGLLPLLQRKSSFWVITILRSSLISNSRLYLNFGALSLNLAWRFLGCRGYCLCYFVEALRKETTNILKNQRGLVTLGRMKNHTSLWVFLCKEQQSFA